MKCPRCKSESEVLETRDGKRRRACLNSACRHRWSTVEVSLQELQQMRADSIRLILVRNMINEGRP
jgi:transcriptional regulator NrdR family protein